MASTATSAKASTHSRASMMKDKDDEKEKRHSDPKKRSSAGTGTGTGSGGNGVVTFNVKLENRLTTKDLQDLQVAFMADGDGYDNKLSLDRDQFVEALSVILTKGSKEEYAELFDKIDVTKEERVDWDKLASHLLLEYHEKDDRVKSTQVPQWKDIKYLPSPHKDIIQRIAYLKNTNRYIAISKEGGVSTWDQHLRLQKTIKLNNESVKPRDLWVTNFVVLQNINKIAISFTSKEIAIYDLSSKLEFNCQYKVYGLDHTPLCMDYVAAMDYRQDDRNNPENSNEAILVFGDTGGFVNAFMFVSANIALFDRPPQPAGEQEQTTYVDFKKLLKGRFKTCRLVRHDGHSEWARQVKYAQHLECFISCATTYENAMVLGWVEKTKSKMRINSFSIQQGVNAFDYHEHLNLIATAGVNHHVCLWNPYVISKPVGLLRGHMAPVVQVQFNYLKGQLISFSKDKVLRIWDVQLQVCLQRLAGMFPKGPDVYSSLFFHEEKSRLFTTFNYQLTVMEMKPEVLDRILSHDKPVTSVVYSHTYNHVVSACTASTVYMWMLDTGQKLKQFLNCHGNAEITALALDQNETRLFTGSADGTLKVWDFTEHCHHTLNAGRGSSAEISQILVLKRIILVMGWDRYITVFRDTQFTQFHIEPSEWKGGQEHQDDILAAAFIGPNTLATGSYDGEIVIWNTNSEVASRHLRQRFIRKSLKSRGEARLTRGAESAKGQPQLGSKQSTQIGRGSRPTTQGRVSVVQPPYIGRVSQAPTRATPASVGLSREVTRISEHDEEDYGHAVTRVAFLEARKNNSAANGANLVSCGGNGWVRFWNTANNELLAEFVAHQQVSSIIMATDDQNHYIVTGDTEGHVKVWNIQEYCLRQPEQMLVDPPPMTATWQPHVDTINSLLLCMRNDRLLIVSGSTDCSVALWDIYGNHIGVFGQEDHWKILPYVPPQEESEEEAESPSVSPQDDITDVSLPGSVQDVDENDESDKDSLTTEDSGWEPGDYDPGYKINTWDETRLGVEYKETRVTKRERRQPGTIPDLPYLHWERTGQPPAGPYALQDKYKPMLWTQALDTSDLNDVGHLKKPDFVVNPHKYFSDPDDPSFKVERLPNIAEVQPLEEVYARGGLKAVFDEKNLFPKYILEFEAKMKQQHKDEVQKAKQKPKKGALKSWSTIANASGAVAAMRRQSINEKSKLGLSPINESKKVTIKVNEKEK
ncbi:LOW QUALITY PROTEIN: cilia- and flagella-associated protein 337-like [Ptychodera flava]|uniref:LOW QUALITY PROTEIN: cilia- and flagella-associated protein 337-like n=1 Tax=Ptychodera flava TaxID=63121 RepID=UPI003969EABC